VIAIATGFHDFIRRPDCGMEKVRIKEIGTHAQLLENLGYYRRLYDLQFNRNPEEPGAEVELLADAMV
jgi:ABC-type multidrug transport system fused ATPase/permease subunit